MTTVLLILLLACCAASLSAQSRIYISVKAGSSAVLPCDWRNKTQSPGERPHIEWRTPSETVFERRGGEQYEGDGYEHRVDVPEDKLLSGDCSLVLKDVRLNDSGPYESYLLERRRRRSLRSKRVFIQAVELSVEDAPEETAAAESIEELSLLKKSASTYSSEDKGLYLLEKSCHEPVIPVEDRQQRSQDGGSTEQIKLVGPVHVQYFIGQPAHRSMRTYSKHVF
ncbi:hypothetical protein SRHO_G00099170 [Serrasalmus rhombeus]